MEAKESIKIGARLLINRWGKGLLNLHLPASKHNLDSGVEVHEVKFSRPSPCILYLSMTQVALTSLRLRLPVTSRGSRRPRSMGS